MCSFIKKTIGSLVLLSLSLSLSLSLRKRRLNPIDGKQYVKEDSRWYVIGNDSDEKYLLDETSLSVKLKEGFPKHTFEDFCKANNIEIERVNMLGIIDLKLPNSADIFGKYNQFKNSKMFEWIDINSYGKIATSYPNDPGFVNQFYIDDRSIYPNIEINTIWEYLNIENIDQSGVIVAVIDLGTDYYNGDLAPNKWSGTGYDFFSEDNIPRPDSNDHHGTAIGGIIAAISNNGIGVAGVAGGWESSTSGTKIMSIRVGQGDYMEADIIDDAIIYAANNGAKIINMSFHKYETNAIKNAISYAYNKKGCLLVGAAGNYHKNYLVFPASESKVMSVSGIQKSTSSHYGNYGEGLDLVAPATDIYSLKNVSTYGSVEWGYIGSGTSFAAPQVVGAGALVWSAYPDLTQVDVRKLINQTATDLGASGYDNLWGYGLLNIYSIFSEMLYPDNLPQQPQNLNVNIVSGHAKLNWSSIQDANKYFIYRSNSVEGRFGFQKVAEVSAPTITWTDYSYNAPSNPNPVISKYYYRVTAVNSNNYESIMSNEVEVGIGYLFKPGISEKIIYSFKLENNYPNPFNPTTTINYEIADNSSVSIKVFDILGREVANIVNEKKEAGSYSEKFDASALTSGIYLYRIEAGNFTASKKMILIK